jgi:single-strand DNA-binding protein
MPALNRIELIGRLGRDPEARFTPSGKKYAVFSIAVSRIWKSADGAKQEATDWFQINAFGKLGEICLQYLKKGRLAFIEGQMRMNRWEDKQSGETRTRAYIFATGLQMLERKPGETEHVEESEVDETDMLDLSLETDPDLISA